MRRFLCTGAGLAALSWALAAPAPALDPGAAPAVPAIAPAAMPGPAEEGRSGVSCTPFGCFRAPSSPWSALAGFGAAAIAAGWIARRQNPD